MQVSVTTSRNRTWSDIIIPDICNYHLIHAVLTISKHPHLYKNTEMLQWPSGGKYIIRAVGQFSLPRRFRLTPRHMLLIYCYDIQDISRHNVLYECASAKSQLIYRTNQLNNPPVDKQTEIRIHFHFKYLLLIHWTINQIRWGMLLEQTSHWSNADET